MTLFFKTRSASRTFAQKRHANNLPAKLGDNGKEFVPNGCKHARYFVSLKG